MPTSISQFTSFFGITSSSSFLRYQKPARLYILRCFHNAINYSQYPSAQAVLALTVDRGPPSSRPSSGPADWQRSCSGICRAQQNAHCSRNSSSISSYSPTRLEDRDSLKMQSVCVCVCALRIFLWFQGSPLKNLIIAAFSRFILMFTPSRQRSYFLLVLEIHQN